MNASPSIGRASALALGALALTACSHAPMLPMFSPPAQERFVHAPQDAQATEPVGAFWSGFQDPLLDDLVRRALAANTDVRSAAASLREARAISRGADANLLPSAGLALGAARVRAQDDLGVSSTRSNYAAGLDLLWEADLFGGLGDARRAAQAGVRAGAEGVRAARVSVVAEVARNYFELRGLQQQLRVATASLDTQQQALRLVEARLDAGRGTALDTERARALVQSTAANVPALEAALIRTRHRIAVLCGRPPSAFDAELAPEQPLPALQAIALSGIGSPASLLRRRPDILAAEARAAAAAAQAGVARSALFPRVILGGTLGQNASRLSALGDGASYVYNLGAQLTWNLLDFGRIRARIAAADARNELAIVAYERTVLAALEETEGALAAYTRSQRQAELLFDAARASEQAALIARERFSAGSTDFLTVLDAERELLAARDRLAQSQTGAATTLVAVYKALGGDWEAPVPAAAAPTTAPVQPAGVP
ncbi:efflux transporter outer membrane subunit [Telluria aromaticivorans]|uniref:TolC family protein n=1 Tax=Telluria aromaticivorans TaxID=2725995 RepID=A0A7Y2NYX5_9BURK|nr:TolC family protein [Telluria aromaticivorans]NNG22528.1 TolC family protein [Telluria aromaticivorans]